MRALLNRWRLKVGHHVTTPEGDAAVVVGKSNDGTVRVRYEDNAGWDDWPAKQLRKVGK